MNRDHVYRSLIALVLVTALAGCGTEPGSGVILEFEGEMTSSNSGFEMTGYLEFDGGSPPTETFHDVSICLYAENGDLLHKENVGDVNLYDQPNISLSLQDPPHYVVLDSSDLDEGYLAAKYYELDEEGGYYAGNTVSSPGEFPVSRCT